MILPLSFLIYCSAKNIAEVNSTQADKPKDKDRRSCNFVSKTLFSLLSVLELGVRFGIVRVTQTAKPVIG